MIGMKDQYFGVEVEMTGITREQAAQALANYFGTEPNYVGGGYDKWSVKDPDGKAWSIMSDSSIVTEMKTESGYMHTSNIEYLVEMVTPKLTYAELPKLQECVRQVRHAGAKANISCGIHVHVDAANHNRQSLKNLLSIMYSKEDILFKALQVNERRASRWCQKVREPMLLALEHGEPLDEAVYCEVMFDKTISGEVPEHRDFIYNTALPRLEQMGVPIRVLRSDKTYVDLFTGQVTRGPKKGKLRSFPICGKCYVQRDCKIRPIRQYQKTLPPDTVHYIGIARDEQERLLRLTGPQVSLLEKYLYTEDDVKQLCRKAGLLSPVYEFTNRGGCWFCPNAKKKELRHLYDHHPDLWARMLELQALPGKVSEKFNRAETFSDIDARFRAEGTQKNAFEMAA